MGTTILAFTVDQIHNLTGLSRRQIRYWDDTKFFSPTYPSQRGKSFGRVYSFQDLVWLRTVALLNKKYKIDIRRLRPVAEWLGKHPSESWSSLTFYLGGKQLFFEDRDLNAWLAAGNPQQTVTPIEMQPIIRQSEAAAAQLRQRTPDEIGKITQKRNVSHNAPVLAGTRVRTEAVWNFHEAGYCDEEILRQYPRLELQDIHEAIKFERSRRGQLEPTG